MEWARLQFYTMIDGVILTLKGIQHTTYQLRNIKFIVSAHVCKYIRSLSTLLLLPSSFIVTNKRKKLHNVDPNPRGKLVFLLDVYWMFYITAIYGHNTAYNYNYQYSFF